MAAHYGTAIIPARPAQAEDKAKVEVAVPFVDVGFSPCPPGTARFSASPLAGLAGLLADLGEGRVTRHLGASRRQLFESLMTGPPGLAGYSRPDGGNQRRAGLDYHVEVAGYYSVPHALAKLKLWARITDRGVEVLHKGKRVAAHMRASGNQRPHDTSSTAPSSHRRHADWTHERICNQASATGPNAHAALVGIILKSGLARTRALVHVHQPLLGKTHGAPRHRGRLRARRPEIGALLFTSLNSILKNNLDRRKPQQATDGPAIDHANIRGLPVRPSWRPPP